MSTTFTKNLLSTSTNGKQIYITSSATLTPVHVQSGLSGSLDEVWLYATNNTTASSTLNVFWGNNTSSDLMTFPISSSTGRQLVFDGKLISGGQAISASVSGSNVVLDGFVNNILVSVDPFISDWVNRVQANGGSIPSNTTQFALNTFYTGLLNTKLINKMMAINCFVPDSLTASLTPLIRFYGNDPWTNHNFISTDLTVNGLAGNGSTKYLDTGVIPSSSFFISNVGLTLYTSAVTAESKLDFGCQDFAFNSNELAIYPNSAGSIDFVCERFINQNTDLLTTNTPGTSSTFAGYYSGNRTSNTSITFYVANSTYPHTAIATGGGSQTGNLGGFSIFEFNENLAGAPGGSNYSSKRHSFAAIHRGLTATESLNFFNLVQALRQNLGGGYV